jgi:putative toxin-antitoxin system antitoxin component (TIGR02293 family)
LLAAQDSAAPQTGPRHLAHHFRRWQNAARPSAFAYAMTNVVREARAVYGRRADYWKRLSSLLALGEPVRTPLELVRALEEGLPLAAMDALVREGYLRPAELAVVAPPRTISHRRARGERLRPDESERLARIGKAIVLAEQVFADKASALAWLHAPKRGFEGRTPFELLASAEGGQLVEEALIAIDEGYVA